MRIDRLVLATVFLGLALSAQAQEPGGGATERNLDSAGSFRNITSTGVTKPPGGAEAPRREPDTRDKSRTLDPKIGTGICVGCD